ncbi:MAG: hypothetical protein ABEJ56_02285 [Candidatus Nanohaloarchaea archaeon]
MDQKTSLEYSGLEFVFRELDEAYNSGKGDLSAAIDYATREKVNLEDIVVAYMFYSQDNADSIAEDYQSLANAMNIELGDKFLEAT